MIAEKNFRIALAKESHFWFFHFYFPHYVTYPTADFHRDIFALTERNDGIVVLVAFRGSGKSTTCTLSYPLWAILGKEQKRFVVILSQTQRQARQHLTNIKKELEQNKLLQADLGPFKEETDEWGGYSLVIPKYEARIMAASSEQSIRGSRHLQHRPDVIIADDVEDLQSVRSQDGRDKTYNWFKGDVLPSGTLSTKVIVIGNLLHEDSLLRRLQNEIDNGTLQGTYREYPIVDVDEKILWSGKFPDLDAVEVERKKLANDIAWQREFLLKIVPEEDQVVHREWVQYYDDMPADRFRWTKVGIDLAISLKTSADYTAMVTGSLYGYHENAKLYIHPFPVNERLDFPSAIEKAKLIADTARPSGNIELLIEEVAYQQAFTQHLNASWQKATGVKVTNDKRSRLAMVSHLIKNGNILFPKKGAEQLVNQIVGFGVEKHDDLMDAFVLLATYAMKHMKRGFPPIQGRIDKI